MSPMKWHSECIDFMGGGGAPFFCCSQTFPPFGETLKFFFFLILKAIKSPQNTKYLANCRARLVTGSVSWRGNCGHLVEQVLLNNRKLIIHPNTNKAFSVFRKKGKWSGTNRIAVPPPPPLSF